MAIHDDGMKRSFAPPDPRLGDGTITLREWAPSDAPAVFAACQDADIQRFVPVPVPYEQEHARGYVDGAAAGWREGRHGALAIAAAQTDEVLGAIGLTVVGSHNVGIGYWIVPEQRRRGIATRAVRLLALWALDHLGVARVELYLVVGNVASARVAERAGFKREGVLRNYLAMHGEAYDCAMYSLISKDLELSG